MSIGRKKMGKKIWIRASNYGGEMTIGEVTKEFVEYWQPIVKEEGDDRLIQHLMALESWDGTPEEEEGFDPDSPAIYADGEHWNNWYECDEIHHDTSGNGTELMAFDFDESGEYPDYDWDTRIDFEPHQLYSRECYTQEEYQNEEPDQDDSVPVLVFYSAEKGDFGGWCIELEDGEEFNPDLVAVSTVETDHGEMIERLWYNKVEYDCDYDFVDSRGKGYYAHVAWFNKRWEDPHINEETDKDMWDEMWEYYDDELADKRARAEEEAVDK